MNFYLYSISIFFSISVFIGNVKALWYEFEAVGFGNSKAGILKTDARVARYNKTTFSVSGTLELTEDLKDNYDCEMKVYYSFHGNNQYVLMPYKIARDSCCKILDSYYFKIQEQQLSKASDLPKRNGSQPLCYSYNKGVYKVKQYAFDSHDFWKFLEAGFYKGEFLIYEKNSDKASTAFSAICRLY